MADHPDVTIASMDYRWFLDKWGDVIRKEHGEEAVREFEADADHFVDLTFRAVSSSLFGKRS